MCLAVPAEVIEIGENDLATCRVGESTATVGCSLMICDQEVSVGDYVVIHAGFAIRKLDPKEAEESLKILRDLVDAADARGIDVEGLM